jgi:hypothetical protein
MKTDQRMEIQLFGNTFEISHKSLYGNLNQLLSAGNIARLMEGKQVLQMASFLSSEQCKARIKLLEQDDLFVTDERGAVFKTGKGRGTRTEAHIMILLLAAEVISSKFHYELHKKIVLERLLEYRDLSGDEFLALNLAVDRYMPGRGDKSNKGIYIHMAKLVRAKILGVDAIAGDWNKATSEQLRMRYRYEEQIIMLLKIDVVKSWEHLKSLIDKL